MSTVDKQQQPPPKTLLVFGANGMLGRYVTCYFEKFTDYDVVPITRQQYDVMTNSFEDLEHLIESNLGWNTYVFNGIGMIPQKAQKAQHAHVTTAHYIKINSVFPLMLSQICEQYGAHLIHATTDCVFSGEKGNYTEIDPKDEKGIYGVTKSIGEPEKACVIRTSIIGEEINDHSSPSFLEFVRANQNESINGFDNHQWNGVTCLQFAKIVQQIIANGLMWEGVRHIFTPTSVSKYELATIINNVYDLNVNVVKYETLVSVDKTLNTIHETNQLLHIPDISTQIYEMKQFDLH